VNDAWNGVLALWNIGLQINLCYVSVKPKIRMHPATFPWSSAQPEAPVAARANAMAEQDKITENRDVDLPVDEQPAILETPESKSIVFQETEMLSKLEEMSQIDEIPVGGVTNIEPDVIGAIAGHAAQTVPGVASLGTASLRRSISERLGSAERWSRGVEVELGRKEAIIDINLRLVYGYSVPSTVIAVRNQVADSLYRYAGLVAKEINIRVVGIDFPRKTPGRVE